MPKELLKLLQHQELIVVGILNGLGALFAGFVAVIRLLLDSNKPSADIHKTNSEALLNEAKAQSIEFQDQLSAMEMMQKFVRDGIALEQLIKEKNEAIAELEDLVFSQKMIIDELRGENKAYESQKLLKLGQKRLSQAENKTGTDAQ